MIAAASHDARHSREEEHLHTSARLGHSSGSLLIRELIAPCGKHFLSTDVLATPRKTSLIVDRMSCNLVICGFAANANTQPLLSDTVRHECAPLGRFL